MSKLTEQNKEHIQDLIEDFETDETLADSDRNSFGTKLITMANFYKAKLNAVNDYTELDSGALSQIAEYRSLYELFNQLHEEYIRLDNFRCHNISRLCGMLSYTDLKLSDKIKNYEY